MELLERYIQAVKRELPKAKQEEITRELRANLIDELDAYSNGENSVHDEQTISKVLRQHGHPRVVAQQFSPRYPLVAGEDMPLYKKVLLNAMTLLFFYSLVMGGSHLVENQSVNAFAYLYIAIGNFIDKVGIVLIVVTLIFYYLGKAGELHKWQNDKWSPNMLPKVDALITGKYDSFSEVTSSTFLLLIVWTPLWMNQETANNLILGFAPEMDHWRIIISLISGYTLLSAVYRLFVNYWTKLSLGIYIVEHIVYLIGMLYLTTLPQLIIVNNPQATKLTPIVNIVFNYGWYFGAVGMALLAVSLTKKWWKL